MVQSGWEVNFLLWALLKNPSAAERRLLLALASPVGVAHSWMVLCPSGSRGRISRGAEMGAARGCVSSISRMQGSDAVPQLRWSGCRSAGTPCVRKVFHFQLIIGTLHAQTA